MTPFLKQRRKRGLRDSQARTRYLTRRDEEHLLAHATPYVRDAMIFAIYSGCDLRSSSHSLGIGSTKNAARLRSRHIAKGKRDRVVILMEEAREVLKRTPQHMRSPYVFHHGLAVKVPPRDASKLPSSCDQHAPRRMATAFGTCCAVKGGGTPCWHEGSALARSATHPRCRLFQERRWSLELVRDQLGHQSVVQTEKVSPSLRSTPAEGAGRTHLGTASHSETPSPPHKTHKG